MTYFISKEETLDRDDIAALQRRKLTAMLREVLARNAFYRAKLGSRTAVELADDFSAAPLTTRSEIQQDQRDHPPFGANLTFPIECYTRMHQTSATSGQPLRVVDGPKTGPGGRSAGVSSIARPA